MWGGSMPVMRRLLFPLLITLGTLTIPAAAHAAVVPSLADRTLTLTGDAAADRIELRSTAATLTVDTGSGPVSFSRAAVDRVVVNGGAGADTLKLTGEADSEEFTVQAADGGVRISRDTDALRVSLTGVETAELDAAGGADLVDVGNLAGTGLDRLRAGLGAGDAARDGVSVQGTAAHDSISVSAAGALARVSGLDTTVEVADANPADDRLDVLALGGPDTLAAVGTAGAPVGLALDGGDGNDVLTGATAAETLRGGAGDDVVRGRQGADDISLGDGADTAIWALGDGDDRLEGDAGADRLQITGASADERYDLTAAGPRVEVLRSTGGRLSAGGVETFEPAPSSGTDTVHAGDLTGTAAQLVSVDLGAKDLRVDTVIADGTPSGDNIKVTSNALVHTIEGLGARVVIKQTDPGEKLVVNGLDGDDTIDANLLGRDTMQPFLDGGAGKDFLIGSPGDDQITGGRDVDVALLGNGLDTFNWTAGDGNDIVEGGAGDNFLRMTGSAAGEHFDVSPVGGRIRLTRDVGNVVLDLNRMTRLVVTPAGGADTMHVADLSGTDAKVVTFELAPFAGTTAGDGSPDRVLVDGTFGDDTIKATAGGQTVRLTGLAAAVEVNRSEPQLDSMFVDTRPGTDSVTVDPQVLQRIAFSFI
jgi:Ca2+-binding RTX toxin-like protein